MKNWIAIFSLLVMGCVVFPGSAGAAVQYAGDACVYADYSQAVVSPFAVAADTREIPCEPGENIIAEHPNNLPYHISVKDFHKFVYNQHTENNRLERTLHSYLFFTGTLLSSESLCKLRRLNI